MLRPRQTAAPRRVISVHLIARVGIVPVDVGGARLAVVASVAGVGGALHRELIGWERAERVVRLHLKLVHQEDHQVEGAYSTIPHALPVTHGVPSEEHVGQSLVEGVSELIRDVVEVVAELRRVGRSQHVLQRRRGRNVEARVLDLARLDEARVAVLVACPDRFHGKELHLHKLHDEVPVGSGDVDGCLFGRFRRQEIEPAHIGRRVRRRRGRRWRRRRGR